MVPGPLRAIVPLPPGLDAKDASLVEPASVALHASRMGGIGPDTRVAVVAAGPVGILAAAAAQTLGAPDIGVEARHPHQHEARERLGVGEPSGAYDVVVETGGTESGLRRAVELVRPGGTVVHLGGYGDIRWPMHRAFLKEVALRASLGYCGHHGRRDFADAADMLAARPELARMLITHRFAIDDAAEAFRVAQDRSKGVFRVVVEP